MILWTIQPIEVVHELERTGKFVCDGRRAERDFRQAYQWMIKQMRKRGIKTKRYPVWAWYRWNCNGQERRGPRLSECRDTCPLNEHFCRIKFEAPDELVLLSDFSLWHCVLNRHFAGTDEEEKKAIEDSLAKLNTKQDLPGIVWEFTDYIRESWERIFDLDLETFHPKIPGWHAGNYITVQACLPYLSKNWVLRTDHFTTKKRSASYIKKWGPLEEEPGFGRGPAKSLR